MQLMPATARHGRGEPVNAVENVRGGVVYLRGC